VIGIVIWSPTKTDLGSPGINLESFRLVEGEPRYNLIFRHSSVPFASWFIRDIPDLVGQRVSTNNRTIHAARTRANHHTRMDTLSERAGAEGRPTRFYFLSDRSVCCVPVSLLSARRNFMPTLNLEPRPRPRNESHDVANRVGPSCGRGWRINRLAAEAARL